MKAKKMQQNIAFDKKDQKSLSSSVNNYKKLLQKGEIKIKESDKKSAKREKKQTRGIVYLGNIPHGFYEAELREYFGQFGRITRVRLVRSKNTGKSKGYAFIEFLLPEVAKIAAETMDKYLMGKRLLKAQYISPEDSQGKDYFKGRNFTADYFPSKINRARQIRKLNSIKTTESEINSLTNMMKQVQKVVKKLKSVGIEYDFKPIAVPDFMNKTKSTVPTSKSNDSEIEMKKFAKKERKLSGIKKSTKQLRSSQIQNKKKMDLIKQQIKDSNQVQIKTVKTIKHIGKNKKSVKTKKTL